jgi:Zn-finger nucleic acid-binding protein
MHDELNSSNNRMNRSSITIFSSESKDLAESMDYFNGEYVVLDKRELDKILSKFKEGLAKDYAYHFIQYQEKFKRQADNLERAMLLYFEEKLNKGDNHKKTMSSQIKKIVDTMCDFNFIGFEEILKDDIYNFKVGFEIDNMKDEYSIDDFNKIIRSFEHTLLEHLRFEIAASINEKQEIVSRYASKAYEVIEQYPRQHRN